MRNRCAGLYHAEDRTRLYARIIKTYFPLFKYDFDIKVIVESGENYRQVVFNLEESLEYIAFLIKRIS